MQQRSERAIADFGRGKILVIDDDKVEIGVSVIAAVRMP